MKISPTLLTLLSVISSSAWAAPATLSRSEQALVDSGKLVCEQYPSSAYLMIGSLKVPCDSPLITARAVDAELDANWVQEYAKRDGGIAEVDENWVQEYAKRDGGIAEVDANWAQEYAK